MQTQPGRPAGTEVSGKRQTAGDPQRQRGVPPGPLACCPRGTVGASPCLQQGRMEAHISLEIPAARRASGFSGATRRAGDPGWKQEVAAQQVGFPVQFPLLSLV